MQTWGHEDDYKNYYLTIYYIILVLRQVKESAEDGPRDDPQESAAGVIVPEQLALFYFLVHTAVQRRIRPSVLIFNDSIYVVL